MFDLLLQLFGLGLLLVGLWLGYRQWLQPHRTALDYQAQGLLLLIILTMMGGAIGSVVWWIDDVRGFAWDVPALASRMLASAAVSFAVICFLTLQRPTYRQVRLVLILLLVYLAPLAAAVVFFHLDRFDPAAPITYAFFTIVISMLVATLWYLFRQPRIIADEQKAAPSGSLLSRGWLSVVALITGIWGLALFVTDSGPSSLIWVWAGDLLSSRLVGVMLLTIAAGSLYSFRTAETTRPMLAMILTYGLGLAAASLWGLLVGQPVPLLYLTVFGLIALVSAVLLFSGIDAGESRPVRPSS